MVRETAGSPHLAGCGAGVHTYPLAASQTTAPNNIMIKLVPNNAILAIIGFILSAYSVYVEHKVEHKDENPGGEEFQALCDIEVRRCMMHYFHSHAPCAYYLW